MAAGDGVIDGQAVAKLVFLVKRHPVRRIVGQGEFRVERWGIVAGAIGRDRVSVVRGCVVVGVGDDNIKVLPVGVGLDIGGFVGEPGDRGGAVEVVGEGCAGGDVIGIGPGEDEGGIR